MPDRELTYAPSQVLHPQYQKGKRLWTDPEVADIVHRLHYGDPTLGWEGDPRLALYIMESPEGHRWELQRLEADGKYRVVCRSRPNLQLGLGLIRHLVAHDLRRKSAQALQDEIDKANARLEKDRLDAGIDKANEAMEKVVWGLRKDVGHHY